MDSQESFPTPQFKSINSLALSFLHSPTLTSIHDHRKNHSLKIKISWLQSPSAVILEPPEIKSLAVSIVSTFICHEVIDSLEDPDAGRDWGQEKKGTTEDEMAGWHHWLDGHESA